MLVMEKETAGKASEGGRGTSTLTLTLTLALT